MKIQRKQPNASVSAWESQCRFFAMCIRRLEQATSGTFASEYNPDEGEAEIFWALPDYELFHEAAYACGFVCNDLEPTYPIDTANIRPVEQLGLESFDRLRHYVHTLLRAERSNRMDGYASPVCAAIQSGALGVVATRLESDESICE